MTFKPSWADPIDLNIGDLCVYIGSTEFSSLSPRVIYRVTDKEETGHSGEHLSRWSFTFEPAFDMFPESHVDERIKEKYKEPGTKRSKNGTKGIRKLSLLELGMLRVGFDTFLRNWAREREGEAG